ncbi:hypothetical protein CYMTET_41984, partial [Cymbomonas tetramitiformis]
MPALVAHRKACIRPVDQAEFVSSTEALLAHRKAVLEADINRHIYVSLVVTSGEPAVSLSMEYAYFISVSLRGVSQRSVFNSEVREFLEFDFQILGAPKVSPHAPIKPPVFASQQDSVDDSLVKMPRKGAHKRKRYTNEEKANAIHFHDGCVQAGLLDVVHHTARETGIPVANISRWANGSAADGLPVRDHVFKAAGDLKLKRLKVESRRGNSSRFPLAEKQLGVEVRARRARGRKVGPRFASVRMKQLVKQYYPDAEFSASPCWRVNFKRREGFATRKRTHKKPQSYASMGRFLFKHRLNVDQVPLPFVVGDYDHTYEDKGAKDVWVRQPGSGLEKRQATLQICIRAGLDAEGKNLPQPPIAIWFRGTGKRISEAEKAAYHPDVHVYWQKCAWVDRATSLEWQNGTLIPWLNEHIPNEESVVFADNLDAQVQAEYLGNQKEKGRAIGWSLLKGGTHWSQPVDQGAGREVKRDIDYEQNEWLEDLDNLEKWENSDLTASDRRVLMTWWAGAGYARTCARVNLNRYFEKSGCLLSVTGWSDEKINPEGLASFTFDRPVLPAVLETAPVQHNVVPTTLSELQQA